MKKILFFIVFLEFFTFFTFFIFFIFFIFYTCVRILTYNCIFRNVCVFSMGMYAYGSTIWMQCEMESWMWNCMMILPPPSFTNETRSLAKYFPKSSDTSFPTSLNLSMWSVYVSRVMMAMREPFFRSSFLMRIKYANRINKSSFSPIGVVMCGTSRSIALMRGA